MPLAAFRKIACCAAELSLFMPGPEGICDRVTDPQDLPVFPGMNLCATPEGECLRGDDERFVGCFAW